MESTALFNFLFYLVGIFANYFFYRWATRQDWGRVGSTPSKDFYNLNDRRVNIVISLLFSWVAVALFFVVYGLFSTSDNDKDSRSANW